MSPKNAQSLIGFFARQPENKLHQRQPPRQSAGQLEGQGHHHHQEAAHPEIAQVAGVSDVVDTGESGMKSSCWHYKPHSHQSLSGRICGNASAGPHGHAPCHKPASTIKCALADRPINACCKESVRRRSGWVGFVRATETSARSGSATNWFRQQDIAHCGKSTTTALKWAQMDAGPRSNQ